MFIAYFYDYTCPNFEVRVIMQVWR